MKYTFEDITKYIGSSINYLTILQDLGLVQKHRKVLAQCECGKIKAYRLGHIKNGLIKSCGCKSLELRLKNSSTHQLSNHPLYDVWTSMKQRCYYKLDINYHNYGGRGVTVCAEWLNNFKTFFDWAISNGWNKNLQLDKDKLAPNQRGILYSPELCCFITKKENLRYRRMTKMLEYNGETKPFMEWCEILKANPKIIRDRLYSGWTAKEAFELPVVKAESIFFNNQYKTLAQWCIYLQVDYSAIKYRIKVGWSINKALSTPIRKLKNNRFNNPLKKAV